MASKNPNDRNSWIVPIVVAAIGAVATIIAAAVSSRPSGPQPVTPTIPPTSVLVAATVSGPTPLPTSIPATAAPTDVVKVPIYSDDFQTDTGKWYIGEKVYTRTVDLQTIKLIDVKLSIIDNIYQWQIQGIGGYRGILDEKPELQEISDLNLEAEMRMVQNDPNSAYGITFRNGGQGLYNLFIRRDEYRVLYIDDTTGGAFKEVWLFRSCRGHHYM